MKKFKVGQTVYYYLESYGIGGLFAEDYGKIWEIVD